MKPCFHLALLSGMTLILQLSPEKPYAVNSRTSVPVSEGDDLSFRQMLDALAAAGDEAEYTCYVRAHDGPDEEPSVQAYSEQLLKVFVFKYAGATGRGLSVICCHRISEESAAVRTPEAVRNGDAGSGVPCSSPSKTVGIGDHVQNDTEPLTGEPLSSLPRADLLLLPLPDSGSVVAISWRGLLRHAKRCLVDGESLFSIVVADVVLTARVWLGNIIRAAPEGADERFVLRDRALRDLHADNKLWQKLKVYTCDLLRMSRSKDAEARFYSDTARFYLGSAYFTADEVTKIVSFPTACGLSFEELLETVFERKSEAIEAGRAQGQGICSSHDLAPIYEQVFGIRNGFQKEKAFQKDMPRLRRSGKSSADNRDESFALCVGSAWRLWPRDKVLTPAHADNVKTTLLEPLEAE